MEQARCNLCGENSPVPYLTTGDRFSDKIFTLSKCSNCGLVYLTPRPTIEEVKEFYPDNYEAYLLPEKSISKAVNRSIEKTLSVQLDFVEHYHQDRGKLLDVGCATGSFLNLAQKRGWQVVGIEIIEKAARIARENYSLNVFTTDLENANLATSSLDVITLWDVLEHLPNPRTAMQIAHEKLKPDGMVYFSIPNLDSYDRKLFDTEWIGWDPPRHFILFEQNGIQRLLRETGFKIIKRKCLTGGKGTFFLSLERIVKKKPSYRWLIRSYAIISILLWPYRQYSYLRLRGPIMYYAARKV
jgi:2-polyprenyl-3-methyl-5-hydroxy-6-metoxy-1,4-benzoquinol methylase